MSTTDRDLWAEESHGFFAWSIAQGFRRQAVSDGLRALAAAWFDDYSDATDLPSWFKDLIEEADRLLGELDIPGQDEDDDDEEEAS